MTSADRPRLLVLTSTYPRWPDDTEPGFVHELCRRLTDAFDVTVIAPHAPGARRVERMEGVVVRRFRYAPAKLERLAFGGGILVNLRRRPWTWLLVLPFLVGMLAAATRELRRGGPAVIHAHWIIPQGLLALVAATITRRRVPVLCTSHGGDLFGLRGKTGRTLKRAVLKRLDAVGVVSDAMRDALCALQPATSSVHVLPMGVDLRMRFTPDPTVVREPGLVLFVGRLVEKKGVSTLLHAFHALQARMPDVRLELVGDGPQRGQLEQQAAVLGLTERVRFVGPLAQAELPERLRRASLFVMPSIEARDGDQEGLGLVQVEAMGCGCPVIASDLPAVRDVIMDGRTGILVPPRDAAALCDAMQRVLGDEPLRGMLAENAREHVRARFDWETAAGRYECLLRELAGKAASTSSNNSR